MILRFRVHLQTRHSGDLEAVAGVTTKRPKRIVGFAAIAAGIWVPYAPNNPPHCVLTKAWLVDALALLEMVMTALAATPIRGRAATPS